MRHYCAATPIEPSLRQRLEKAGLTILGWQQLAEAAADDVLVIYSPPDQILQQWRIDHETAPLAGALTNLFEALDTATRQQTTCVASWRLEQLDTTSIIQILHHEQPNLSSDTPYPHIKPLTSLITLKLIRDNPGILNYYQNLELHSNLLGLQPDSQYRNRLNSAANNDLILMDWWEVNLDRESTHEEVQNTLLRMHQIQEDYDQLVNQQESVRQLLSEQNKVARLALTELARHKQEA